MAYKVFTNGSPLPASDLNTYLMNQSVMVFANSTARSAALTSPTEGMVTYLEDTNKLEVYTGAAWVDVNDNAAAIPKSTVTTAGDLIVADGNASVTRLGIGTNGQVLSSNGTTATWTTPSAGGTFAWVSLASGSFPTTGGVEVNLTSITAYDKYLLAFKNVSSTTGSEYLDVWINGENTSNTSFATYGTLIRMTSSYDYNIVTLAPTDRLRVRWSTNANSVANGALLILGAQSPNHKVINWTAGTNAASSSGNSHEAVSCQGFWKNTAAITSLKMVATNSTDGGTYELYGSN